MFGLTSSYYPSYTKHIWRQHRTCFCASLASRIIRQKFSLCTRNSACETYSSSSSDCEPRILPKRPQGRCSTPSSMLASKSTQRRMLGVAFCLTAAALVVDKFPIPFWPDGLVLSNSPVLPNSPPLSTCNEFMSHCCPATLSTRPHPAAFSDVSNQCYLSTSSLLST